MKKLSVRLLVAMSPGLARITSRHVPLGVLLIASVLEKIGIEVEIFDFQLVERMTTNYDVKAMAQKILEGPRVVGISVMCDGLPLVAAACEEAKKQAPDKIIVLGGAGPSFVAVPLMERFPSIDVTVVGEGEITAQELFPLLCNNAPRASLGGVAGIVYRDGGAVIQTQPRQMITNLDSLPQPAYHLVDVTKYQEVGIHTSRGCPYYCTFCSTSPLWGRKVRYRSPDSVVNEIETLRNRGCNPSDTLFHFSDDLFTSSLAHVRGICDKMKERSVEMAWNCLARVNTINTEMLDLVTSSHCAGIAVGIESGSDRVLQMIQKGNTVKTSMKAIDILREYPQLLKFFFMWGFPGESRIDLLQTTLVISIILERLVPKKTIN